MSRRKLIALGWVTTAVVAMASIAATWQPIDPTVDVWRCSQVSPDAVAALIAKVITHAVLVVGMVTLRWTVFARRPVKQPAASAQALTFIWTTLPVAALAAFLFWVVTGIGYEIHQDYGRGDEGVCSEEWLRWPIVGMHWASPGVAAAIDVGVGRVRFKADKRQLLPWTTIASFALQILVAVLMIQR